MWFVTYAQAHAAMEADTGTDAGTRANVGIMATLVIILLLTSIRTIIEHLSKGLKRSYNY